MNKITSAINDSLKKFNITPYEINNGTCDEFSQLILESVDGGIEFCTESLPQPIADLLPGHVWIYYKGKHYDAETPLGVYHFYDLPIFAKALKRRHYIRN